MRKSLVLVFALLLSLGAFAQLPSVSLKTMNGKTVDTAKLNNNGKPFIISFFATWCKPCQRELNAIQQVYDEWQDETGVKVYAVSIDQGQNISKVKPMVDSNGWDYEVLLDPNSDFKRAMNVNMIPAVFIVDGGELFGNKFPEPPKKDEAIFTERKNDSREIPGGRFA